MHVRFIHVFKYILSIIFFIVIGICTSYAYSQPVQAQSAAESQVYDVTYDADFYFQKNTKDIQVKLAITLTNNRSDVYITEYALSIPDSVPLKGMKISSEKEEIPYVVSDRRDSRRITFKFGEPETAFETHKIILTYTIDDMHISAGKTDEVILPLFVAEDEHTLHVNLHIPDDFTKQLSMSKPRPSLIQNKVIRWENVEQRSIFTLFGDSQMYDVHLTYSLDNPGLTKTTKTIALPPETLYQKVYIDNLSPTPNRTYTDEDGNFLAEYEIASRQELPIVFDGKVEVFVKPQDHMRDIVRSQMKSYENLFLADEEQWDLGEYYRVEAIQALKTPQDIYSFVTDTLQYSYGRLQKEFTRYGASKALKDPDLAVCMEYTDVFIALAREKGIPAREIQGYGFSLSKDFRPQSLVKDELHAWPEFYDRAAELWFQVDPTWEDTSGIDYFTGFDVNHIALAIHGKDPWYPLPAGFYKTAATKDVTISLSEKDPVLRKNVKVDHDLPKAMKSQSSYTTTITVTNLGNTFIYYMNVVPQAKHITFSQPSIALSYLAPYESKTVELEVTTDADYTENDVITFSYDGTVLGTHDVALQKKSAVTIPTPILLIFTCALLGLAFWMYNKRRGR